MSSNIPSSPGYGVFISQLIQYTRACSPYECFILRVAWLSSKLLGQGTFEIVPREIVWSLWGSHQTLWNLHLLNVTLHFWTWPYTVTPSIDQTLHQFVTLIPILILLPNFGRFQSKIEVPRDIRNSKGP